MHAEKVGIVSRVHNIEKNPVMHCSFYTLCVIQPDRTRNGSRNGFGFYILRLLRGDGRAQPSAGGALSLRGVNRLLGKVAVPVPLQLIPQKENRLHALKTAFIPDGPWLSGRFTPLKNCSGFSVFCPVCFRRLSPDKLLLGGAARSPSVAVGNEVPDAARRPRTEAVSETAGPLTVDGVSPGVLPSDRSAAGCAPTANIGRVQRVCPSLQADAVSAAGLSGAATTSPRTGRAGPVGAATFSLTEAQRESLAFAALCQVAILEESHEADEAEVQEAIRTLCEAQSILEGRQP